MAYNRQTGWGKQDALTVGAVLRATSVDVAAFGAGMLLGEYEQDVSPSGAVYEAAGQLPAGALVIGVTARVLTAITGCVGWSLGSATMPEAWGRALSVVDGESTTSTVHRSGGLTAVGSVAQPAVLTAIDGTFTGGSVRLRTYYLHLGAP